MTHPFATVADSSARVAERSSSSRASRTITTQRRHFGTTRKLPSGRWQARYFDSAGVRHKAPRTFASKTDALQWLATVEADLARGDWHDPKLAATTLNAWVEQWRPTTAS